jgi:hypothetical protein
LVLSGMRLIIDIINYLERKLFKYFKRAVLKILIF